jgi:uncharacterized protein YkwD
MKHILLIGLLSIMFSFESTGQKKALKYASDVATLKEQLKTDSILRFEYACALEFHKYLNAYRISRKLKPLRWNDTLWVVAMNHGNYLNENDLFSHQQIARKSLFSGIQPGNRYDFVVKSKHSIAGYGENLFMTSIYYKNSPDQYALEAFSAWKKSPGHNKNMLFKSFEEHGTAIVSSESGLIFTDFFSLNSPTFKEKKRKFSFGFHRRSRNQ